MKRAKRINRSEAARLKRRKLRKQGKKDTTI